MMWGGLIPSYERRKLGFLEICLQTVAPPPARGLRAWSADAAPGPMAVWPVLCPAHTCPPVGAVSDACVALGVLQLEHLTPCLP